MVVAWTARVSRAVGLSCASLATFILLFKRQQCKKSLGFVALVLFFWKRYIEFKLSRDPAAEAKAKQRVIKFCKGGLSGKDDTYVLPNLPATLEFSRRMLLRALKVWYEIQVGDALPNYAIHSYDPQSTESARMPMLTAISPKLTVLNFGSCTCVCLLSL